MATRANISVKYKFERKMHKSGARVGTVKAWKRIFLFIFNEDIDNIWIIKLLANSFVLIDKVSGH